MIIKPLSFRAACDFVKENHRHHKPPQGHKFSIGLYVNDELIGVVIVGRPIARMSDNGTTAEVTRLCTDGTHNACSKLYSAARKTAFAMGYTRIITYILSSESGGSLKASGWVRIGERGGGSWSVPSRPRTDKHPLEKKVLWQVTSKLIAEWTRGEADNG